MTALRVLLDEPAYAFESSAAVESAVQQYATCRAGFADCLIAAKNSLAGCEFTATFDRALRAVPQVKVF